jgi:hypothetical protein
MVRAIGRAPCPPQAGFKAQVADVRHHQRIRVVLHRVPIRLVQHCDACQHRHMAQVAALVVAANRPFFTRAATRNPIGYTRPHRAQAAARGSRRAGSATAPAPCGP